MEDNAKAMVLASFAADSLALGAHWIYDTSKISQAFGRVDSFLKPAQNSYHPTKDKGEFTHYGDQTLVLLESLAARRGFDLQDFSARWRNLFDGYRGYIDGATRVTLSEYASGKNAEIAGSPSDDLAGASRLAPLVYCYRGNLDALASASRSQTNMTHTNPLTIESAEFFARVASLVLEETAPVKALNRVREDHYRDNQIGAWVKAGIESRENESLPAIARFGQSCHTPAAFPGVIHLIARYEDDLEEALIQSVMAGGDSAARGMIVGMILGAHLGVESIPERWLTELRKKDEILRHLQILA
jgi:ADP-ribosylglycohydrolase